MFKYFKTRLRFFVILTSAILCSTSVLADKYVVPEKVPAQNGQKPMGPLLIPYSEMRSVYQIPAKRPIQTPRQPPESAWRKAEMSFYEKMITAESYQVLVVPFQVEYSPVDQIERLLMANRLAFEIEALTDLSVAPVWLVHRALGGNRFGYDDDSVRNLAYRKGVKWIVWGYGGFSPDWKTDLYDKLPLKRQFHFTVILEKLHDPKHDENRLKKTFPHKSWRVKAAARHQLPSQAFSAQLSEVMHFLDLTPKRNMSEIIEVKENFEPTIPEKRKDIFEFKNNDPIQQAYRLQFLAMLAAKDAENQKNNLFIKSITAVSRLSPSTPHVRLLLARAYHHLNRRPSALAALAQANSPAEKAMVQLLNGNLPELEAWVKKITNPVQKLLAEIELADLRSVYLSSPKKLDFSSISSVFPEWQFLIERRLRDRYLWEQFSNLHVKMLLDYDFPLPDFQLEKTMQAATLSGIDDKKMKELELLFYEHIHQYLEIHKQSLLENESFSRPGHLDYLQLIDGIGESNLVRAVNFQTYVQGRPSAGLALLDVFNEIYKDHPRFLSLQANSKYSILSQKRSTIQTQLIDEIALESFCALLWAGTPDMASNTSLNILRHVMKMRPDIVNREKLLLIWWALGNSRREVFPIYLPYENNYGSYSNEYRFKWTHDQFDIVKHAYDQIRKQRIANKKERIKKLLGMIEGRFHGHPERVNFLANHFLLEGDRQKAISLYSEEIERGSDKWNNYYELGELYIHDGQYKRARDVFLSYPHFTPNSNVSSVELSNASYLAGSMLFWRGAAAEAIPLYRFSADLQTGSDGSLSSEARLAILDKDYQKAATVHQRRAKRYDTYYAYRDFINLLHLMGESEIASALSQNLLNRFDSPEIWTSLWVEHRIQNKSKDDIKSWLKVQAERQKKGWKLGFVARYGLLSMLDREPDLEFARFIYTLDNKSGYKYNGSTFSGPDGTIIGPQLSGLMRREKQKEIIKNKGRYLSFYGSLAEAYTLARLKRYKEAYQLLYNRSAYFNFTSEIGRPVLPLFVRCGIKSGDVSLERKVRHFTRSLQNSLGSEKEDFYIYLSDAQLEASVKNHEKAVKHLEKAFNLRPHNDKRPFFTWYHIVEICEWLYEDSGKNCYKELALRWSRAYQNICPWFGWAYAVEAKYSKDPEARIRSLACAMYFDPQSQRIAHFTEREKKAATRWMEVNQPFSISDVKSGV